MKKKKKKKKISEHFKIFPKIPKDLKSQNRNKSIY